MPAKKGTTKRTTKPTSKSSSKSSSTTKSESVADTTPAPAPAKVAETTASASATTNKVEEVSVLQQVNERYATMIQELDAQRKSLSETIKQVREMQKQTARDVKALEKRASRRKPRKQGEHKPSGFAKEALISDELAKFLGKESGTMMARTHVTKEINAYIKKHKLQDPNHGKIINPDKRLKTLLRVGTGEELTYFNLQKYMKHLFPKPAPPATTASA